MDLKTGRHLHHITDSVKLFEMYNESLRHLLCNCEHMSTCTSLIASSNVMLVSSLDWRRESSHITTVATSLRDHYGGHITTCGFKCRPVANLGGILWAHMSEDGSQQFVPLLQHLGVLTGEVVGDG